LISHNTHRTWIAVSRSKLPSGLVVDRHFFA
jgi:hypothetical protein